MKNNRALVIALIAFLFLVLISAGRYLLDRGRAASRSQPPIPVIAHGPAFGGPDAPPHDTADGTAKGVIYVVSASGGDDNNLIAEPVTWHASQDPARDALVALAGAADGPLPTGTEVRGVRLSGGLATVDLSREYQSNFHGGETQEAQAVNSILLTLGQFPGIDRVQILVEGKPIDALSQLPLSSPLDVIRPKRTGKAND